MASLSGSPEPDARARPGGRRALWAIPALVLAAVLAYELLQWPAFRLREVEVTGLRLQTAAQVLREAGLRYQVPIWQIRPAQLAARLERDPLIEGATVRIVWPDRLVIDVVERTAVAALPARGGGYWWVDRFGVPFLKRSGTAGLPVVRFARAMQPEAGRALGAAAARPVALAALLSDAQPPVGAIDVHADGSITLWLQPQQAGNARPPARIPVWIDAGSSARQVAEELLGVLAEARRRGQSPLYVDLRAPGLPAVAWPPKPPAPSSPAAPAPPPAG